MTPFPLKALIQRHASKGLLIDTNVLLMYLVGLHDPNYIPQFKRTQKYTEQDFAIARGFIRHFHSLITTPHVLSELSNLSRGVQAHRAEQYFRSLVQVLTEAREEYVRKDCLLGHAKLPLFGFTDLSILEAAKRLRCLALTDDLPATGMMQAEECAVVNFNHLRQMHWSL